MGGVEYLQAVATVVGRGDMTGGMGVAMKDFWQSYPSALEITETKGDKATLTAWLWSPDAEPMDLRHYDNVAHGLLCATMITWPTDCFPLTRMCRRE